VFAAPSNRIVFSKEDPMKLMLMFLLSLPGSLAFATQPNPTLTPGELCTPNNPDFAGYRYAANIAYCKRNVSLAEKQQIAKAYGDIPESEWPNYEFDHLIPLNAGGDSSIANLWPQPIAEAKEKDKLEQEIFNGLSRGSLTQSQAVQMVWDWVNAH
jgi:hypothetical protein